MVSARLSLTVILCATARSENVPDDEFVYGANEEAEEMQQTLLQLKQVKKRVQLDAHSETQPSETQPSTVCSANPGCFAIGLIHDNNCCPTDDGMMLSCCDAAASPSPSDPSPPAPAPPAPSPPQPAPAPPAPAPPHSPPAPVPHGSCGNSDLNCIVGQLNGLYTAFDENNPNSPGGVTMRMATPDDFQINCGHGCFHGYSDCKMSASVYNHMVMRSNSGVVNVAMSRSAGFVFHQDLVENSIGKCYFQYDGGTYWNLNRGCGCHASQDCNDPNGAYLSTATAGDENVDRCSCEAYAERHGGQLPGRNGQLCFHRGASFNTNDVTPDNNHIHGMMAQRLASQRAAGDEDSMESWNEVVLDGALMQDHLGSDPYSVVQAFFYVRGRGGGESFAYQMRDRFATEYQGAQIPVIELDPDGGSSGQPFRVPAHRES